MNTQATKKPWIIYKGLICDSMGMGLVDCFDNELIEKEIVKAVNEYDETQKQLLSMAKKVIEINKRNNKLVEALKQIKEKANFYQKHSIQETYFVLENIAKQALEEGEF